MAIRVGASGAADLNEQLWQCWRQGQEAQAANNNTAAAACYRLALTLDPWWQPAHQALSSLDIDEALIREQIALIREDDDPSDRRRLRLVKRIGIDGYQRIERLVADRRDYGG
jgi:hypothetical protein